MNQTALASRRATGVSEFADQQSRFANSGLSTRDFCAVEGISTATFYKRRARVREMEGSAGAPARHQLMPVSSRPARQEFIDIGAVSGGGACVKAQVHLDLGGGVVVQISRY